jgi:NAD(P)H-dependent FMN reductase
MIVAVLQGSVRSDRMGDRVAKWVVSQLEAREHEVHLVDAAELKLPLLDRMWKELKGGDESAIVCYSATPFGGVRAAMQLRALLAETGMSSIPSIQAIPKVGEALSSEGVALTQDLAEKSSSFFDEFEWYMAAMKAGLKLKDPRKT